MALEAVQLDTLNWDQMVSAIRTRIIADSNGNWTLHAPVDPGVTLIELFAWLLDQRIYWVDQIPNSLLLAILALLDQPPLSAQPAITLFELEDNAPVVRPYLSVSADTAFRLLDSNPPLIFSVDQDLILLPISAEPVTLMVDGIDYTNDVIQGRLVRLLRDGKNSAQIQISLPLNEKIPDALAGKFFTLMFELETPKDVWPQWTSTAAISVPPPATLQWSYPSDSKGTSVPFSEVNDGTAGLRRSGVVRLPLVADWRSQAAGEGASISYTYTVLLEVENASYTFVPRLVRLLPNVVLAHHGWHRMKSPSTKKWPLLPGNVISLPAAAPNDSSLKEYPPIENTVQMKIKEADGNSYDWNAVLDLSFYGPSDRVFVVDRTRSELRFGDGLTGRLPVTSGTDSDIEVNYDAGAGTAGNVGENLNWEAIKEKDSDPDPLIGGVNVVAGDGGKDTETLIAAQQRAQSAINERNRAVTKADYENLALSTPGVALRRAYAAIGYHQDFPCTTVPGVVTVFVVPYAPREQTDGALADDVFVPAPQPDAGALQAAQSRLSAAKLLGGEVFVVGPVYRPVWLVADIAVDKTLPVNLRQQIATRLQTFLDPLVGGDVGEGWPFGDPLRPSALVKQAQDVLGQAGDVLRISVCIDGMTTPESCLDVPISGYELVKLENVDFHIQQRIPHFGGLR